MIEKHTKFICHKPYALNNVAVNTYIREKTRNKRQQKAIVIVRKLYTSLNI